MLFQDAPTRINDRDSIPGKRTGESSIAERTVAKSAPLLLSGLLQVVQQGISRRIPSLTVRVLLTKES